MKSDKVYLDYAAATPLDPEVLAVMQPYFAKEFYNPSATYLSARTVRNELKGLRAVAALALGAKPAEIIFTSGATEANNLAVLGISRHYPQAEILVSSIEHDSVLAPAGQVGAKLIPVNEKGVIDLAWLKKAISDQTVLVSVMFVNNEIGTLQPLSEVAAILKEVRRQRLASGNKLPVYLHTDATQAVNFYDVHVSKLGVDLMSINGGKIYGPKGSGLLYMRAGIQLTPLLYGGGQELGVRSGTENVPSIAGLATALKKAQALRAGEAKRLTGLRQKLEQGILSAYPEAVIQGGKHRAPHIVSATFPGQDNETLMIKLDEAGVECALGSACSASNEEPSHVLRALGMSDELAQATLRFSLGRQTDEADIEAALKALSVTLGN